MKIWLSILIAFVLFSCIYSCKNSADKKQIYTYPKPGTVVVNATQPVKEETLNHYKFAAQIKATDKTNKGVYEILATWGPDTAHGTLVMPDTGSLGLQPILRSGSEPYTYVIGFRMEKDTTFMPYLQIAGSKDAINMKYTNAYSFQ